MGSPIASYSLYSRGVIRLGGGNKAFKSTSKSTSKYLLSREIRCSLISPSTLSVFSIKWAVSQSPLRA